MRLTSRGVALLCAAAVLLAAGFRFGYPELALLGTCAAVAVVCALGYAAGRPRLGVTRVAEPDRVARGEPATMTLTVRNAGRLRRASLVAEDRCGNQPVAVPLLRLRPGHDTTVSYPVPTHRRGVIPVGPLRVTGRDVLGLVRFSRRHGPVTDVWVHPRVHPLSAVPAGVARSLDGQIDRVPHGSITFDSLREYVVGDELRRVHWRTSARVGELMVREHVDTSLPTIVVLLDNRAVAHPVVDGFAATFESACEAAASVVAAATREGLTVSLLLVVPDSGQGGYLDRLTEADLRHGNPGDSTARGGGTRSGLSPGGGSRGGRSGDDPLRTATDRLRQQRLGDTLVFLTGPGGRADLGRLGALHGAYPSVVVAVFDPAGQPPAAGHVEPAGPAGPGGRPTGGTGGGSAGVVVIDAADGARFAAAWNGVDRW
ncbi:DUF58 domain-containing protein [Polymorphospora lycopeni]|uniref:DUF58 domain-containing protein n=1 Tax=Polymorphospora lycopeni TaxID=3140240 RepID=A0ABV5CY21_9ACTN